MSKEFSRVDKLAVGSVGDLAVKVASLESQLSGLLGMIGAIGERGEWTPVWEFSDGTMWNTYETFGSYTKIGDLVFCSFQISVGTIRTGPAGGNADVTVGGLPFLVGNGGMVGTGSLLSERFNADRTPANIIRPIVGTNSASLHALVTAEQPVPIKIYEMSSQAINGNNAMKGSFIYFTAPEAP